LFAKIGGELCKFNGVIFFAFWRERFMLFFLTVFSLKVLGEAF